MIRRDALKALIAAPLALLLPSRRAAASAPVTLTWAENKLIEDTFKGVVLFVGWKLARLTGPDTHERMIEHQLKLWDCVSRAAVKYKERYGRITPADCTNNTRFVFYMKTIIWNCYRERRVA